MKLFFGSHVLVNHHIERWPPEFSNYLLQLQTIWIRILTFSRTCEYARSSVLTDVTFFSKSGRQFGPFANCRNVHHHYKGPFRVALDMDNIALQFEYINGAQEGFFDHKFLTAVKDASEIKKGKQKMFYKIYLL